MPGCSGKSSKVSILGPITGSKNAIEGLDNKLRNARFLTLARACHVKRVNHVFRYSEPIRSVSLAGVNMQLGFVMFSCEIQSLFRSAA